MIEVSWKSIEDGAVEQLRLSEELELRAVSSIRRGEAAVRYEVVLGSDWRVRTVELESTEGGALHISSDGQGGWMVNGTARPDLAEAVDIDFVLTPFTNTLPIRRLSLDDGEAAEIVVAWIDFPSLEVRPDPQRYTRIDAGTYRFDSLDSDFTRELTVDEHGLVVEYPGLFTRAG